ncbi:MAG: amidohydrolase family protein [Methanomicrobia archaeon]|nr:amidohydrolase family protein [Methanomicrobia archaeon]
MQRGELILSGIVVRGKEFDAVEGSIVVEQGIIKELSEQKVAADLEGIIVPAFVNAHTHIGDAVAKEPPALPLEQLVGPGGFKHRILAETPYAQLVTAMQETITDMLATGTQLFADFREGGIRGTNALREALKPGKGGVKPHGKILGRPADSVVKEELEALFALVDGIGMSSVADHDPEDVRTLAAEAKGRGKLFALHAGERTAEDIEGAVELEPNYIVHLVKASSQDFTRMVEKGIAAVVCVRANLVNGLGVPPVKQMLEAGLTVALGTDNVMLNAPDMLTEMEFIAKLFRLDDREVLRMCTLNAAQVLQEAETIGSLEEGKRANLVVISTETANMRHVRDPVKGVVRRATRNDILAVVHDGELYHSIRR